MKRRPSPFLGAIGTWDAQDHVQRLREAYGANKDRLAVKKADAAKKKKDLASPLVSHSLHPVGLCYRLT